MGWIDKIVAAWHRRDTRKRVEKDGWTAIYVGDYDRAPSWVYSVGFQSTLGQPEVIAFDMPRRSAAQFVAQVFDELRDGRLVLEDGRGWVTASTRCVWRKVREEHLGEWLTLAFVPALLSGGLEAYQLVLSDSDGRLPWETGYDERLRALQPSLYEPPAAQGT